MTDQPEYDLRGATIIGADLTGATFRECTMQSVRMIGCIVSDVELSGFAGSMERLVVDDVDVTAYVAAELDRRHPERVQLRSVRSADDHRAMWGTIERMWTATHERVAALPADALDERVGDEWSFAETLRHLVFATDVWAGRMVLQEDRPFHPLGLPTTDYDRELAVSIGIDVDARPTLAEVMAARSERCGLVRNLFAGMTDRGLEEMRTGEPAPGWGAETLSVGRCLRVILREECEHHRYAVRDLDRAARSR